MEDRGIPRIYDVGNFLFKLILWKLNLSSKNTIYFFYKMI
jgi:hypothetical protein